MQWESQTKQEKSGKVRALHGNSGKDKNKNKLYVTSRKLRETQGNSKKVIESHGNSGKAKETKKTKKY